VADGWCWFVLREKYYWLVAGLLWEKSTAGWWLISQANRAIDCAQHMEFCTCLLGLEFILGTMHIRETSVVSSDERHTLYLGSNKSITCRHAGHLDRVHYSSVLATSVQFCLGPWYPDRVHSYWQPEFSQISTYECFFTQWNSLFLIDFERTQREISMMHRTNFSVPCGSHKTHSNIHLFSMWNCFL
jgi:hypothetical protein